VVDRPLNTALGWRIPAWLLDYGPVALIGFVGIALIIHDPQAVGPGRAGVAVAVTVGALSLRRRAPLAVLGVVLGVSLVLDYKAIVVLPILLGVFNVVEYSARRKMLAAVAAATFVVIVTPFFHGAHEGPPAILSRLVAVGLAVSAGLYLRARADYIGGLRERAERLERERELLSEQAVSEERVRIARELHDVVAHNVSLMVVQAQALAATNGGDGRLQGDALGRVADLGREALSEMHRMLGVLRLQNGAGAEREPQPGVRDLSSLVERTREAGLLAELRISGERRELPPGVDLSVYRIVQEALTNVIRHAAAKHAEVTLAYSPQSVEITVVDDGLGAADADAGGDGHGLVGMRERVALFGGELTAARRADAAGYRVHAVLPIGH
jgi:signal transduction histidine kinase